MKLPAKGSRGMALIEYLATVESQDIAAVVAKLSDRMTEKSARAGISEMYLAGHIDNLSIEQGDEQRKSAATDTIALAIATRYELEDAEDDAAAKKAAAIVPPRIVNVLTGPALDKSRFINTKGTRTGSDWSQFKSRQL